MQTIPGACEVTHSLRREELSDAAEAGAAAAADLDGSRHPDAIRRAASLADGWMGSGGSSIAEFSRSVPLLREALEQAGRDPGNFPISKRVFMAVDDRPEVARGELSRWFTEVYRNPAGTDASGIHGTPEHVHARMQELIAMGATHLLLNPVSRHVEQLEALAQVVGLL